MGHLYLYNKNQIREKLLLVLIFLLGNCETREARSQLPIRAKKYEVKDFLRDYIWDVYIEPIPMEIKHVLSKMNELKIYSQMERAQEVRVSYGEILERLKYMWKFYD